jgi:hypothetical protein
MGTTTATMDRNADGEQGRRKKGGFRTMPLILGEEIEYRICLHHRLMLQLVVYTNLWSLHKLLRN